MSFTETLSQEIFAITTILEALHSSAIPHPDEPDANNTISKSTHLSHIFVPESGVAAAVSTVFNAQRLDIFVAIDDKRDPRKVENTRSEPAGGVAAEQCVAIH